MMRPTPILLAAMAAFLLGTASSGAQDLSSSISIPNTLEDALAPITSNPFETRGATLPPVMRYLQGEGIPLVFLGEAGGVKGYLGESANGRNQVVYPMPDGEHVVAGLLFRSGGQQITKIQITDMIRRFGEAAASVPDADLTGLTEVPPIQAEVTGGDADLPIVDWFRNSGKKVTSLGARDGGVDAYLVENPSSAEGAAGKMQVFYVLPDPKYAVAGIMLRRGGVNVTGLQIGKLQERYLAEARAAAESSGIDTEPAGAVPEAELPAAEGVDAPALPAVAADAVPGDLSSIEVPEARGDDSAAVRDALSLLEGLKQQAPVLPPPGAEASAAAGVPAPVMQDIVLSTATADAAEPYRSAEIVASDLIASANDTVYFTVGLPNTPAVYMVADPQCPFCHETWRQLKPLVFNGKMQLRVIMIAGLAGSDPIARTILSREDPSAAWLGGQGSVKGVAVTNGPVEGSEAWAEAGAFLDINSVFLRKFGVTKTPFLAYVTPGDEVFASRGLPPDMNAFLAALK